VHSNYYVIQFKHYFIKVEPTMDSTWCNFVFYITFRILTKMAFSKVRTYYCISFEHQRVVYMYVTLTILVGLIDHHDNA
jgi:hypothetical protein